jgi:hypothetical protein
MKKRINDFKKKPRSTEMLPEYNFRGQKGVRGKYYQAHRKGHTVRIHREDGTVSVQHFTSEVDSGTLARRGVSRAEPRRRRE